MVETRGMLALPRTTLMLKRITVTQMPIPSSPGTDTRPNPKSHRELRLLYQRRAAVEELIRAIEAYKKTAPPVQPIRGISADPKS
jgi:hypothetical protein